VYVLTDDVVVIIVGKSHWKGKGSFLGVVLLLVFSSSWLSFWCLKPTVMIVMVGVGFFIFSIFHSLDRIFFLSTLSHLPAAVSMGSTHPNLIVFILLPNDVDRFLAGRDRHERRRRRSVIREVVLALLLAALLV
jgi:hypothetical protein